MRKDGEICKQLDVQIKYKMTVIQSGSTQRACLGSWQWLGQLNYGAIKKLKVWVRAMAQWIRHF